MIQCWYYRKTISNSVDVGVDLSGAAQAHVRNCPACRRHYESELDLVRQLSASAKARRQAPSPFLHARIMRAVENSDPATGRGPARDWLGWSVVLGTACVVAGGFLLLHQPEKPKTGVVELASASRAQPPELSLDVKLPNGARLGEWASKLDEPLQTEMKLVVSDTRTAVDSLADSFLPKAVRASLFEPAPN